MLNELEKMKKNNEKVLEKVENQFDLLLWSMEDLQNQCSDFELQAFGLSETLEEKETEIRQMKAELRFLGKIISACNVDIPLTGHSVNFGMYLNSDDERRTRIEWEEACV
ncbi:MAG: hypothetical protein IJ719_07685 [Clostridia bacterium]|nr:hypothetical protein [Clostridia bacterium]